LQNPGFGVGVSRLADSLGRYGAGRFLLCLNRIYGLEDSRLPLTPPPKTRLSANLQYFHHNTIFRILYLTMKEM
jgi:hypothetical protein